MPRVRSGPAAVLAVVLLCAAVGLGAGGAAATVTPGWQWPLDPAPRVVREFEVPGGPFAAGHRGVDLAARVGQRIRSAGPGVVAFTGLVAGRGVVTVDHRGGRSTTYEPVAAVVTAGDPVAAGGLLGTVSSAPGHCLPGTCLHWGLRRWGSYLDPLGLVRGVQVRLLPVWGQSRSGRAAASRR